MVKLDYIEAKKISTMFLNPHDSCIRSFFEGRNGECYSDEKFPHEYAIIVFGDFVFLGGEPKDITKDELLTLLIKINNQHVIIIPFSNTWTTFIRDSRLLKEITRYHIDNEYSNDKFDPILLQSYKDSLPDNYTYKFIDEKLFYEVRKYPQFEDFTANISNYETFEKEALGVVVLDGDKIVAGASSFSFFQGGIELQLDTDEAYRGKGIATAVAATLILECIHRNLYPCWDAANLTSVRICTKLGYHCSGEYVAFEYSDTL